MVNKRTIPAEKTLLKAKKYIDNYYSKLLPNDKIEDCFPEIPENETESTTTTATFVANVNANSIIDKYKDEIANNCELIDVYKDKIKDLEIRNRVCEEVLNVIEELRNEG